MRTARRKDADVAVLTASGSLQEVNKHSINVGVPRDGAGSHWVSMGSHATGMCVIAESTGVIGARMEDL